MKNMKCIHIYTHIHIYVHTCVYIYIYTHTHTHTMAYYLAKTKNEINKIIPFTATWLDPEITILSKINQRERQISYDITSMWHLKKKKKWLDELICKTEIEPQI